MKIITINLSEKYLAAIQVLVSRRMYPSRSECIRAALHEFLADELQLMANLDPETFEMIIRSRIR